MRARDVSNVLIPRLIVLLTCITMLATARECFKYDIQNLREIMHTFCRENILSWPLSMSEFEYCLSYRKWVSIKCPSPEGLYTRRGSSIGIAFKKFPVGIIFLMYVVFPCVRVVIGKALCLIMAFEKYQFLQQYRALPPEVLLSVP